MVFPKNNLPTQSQPWTRDVEKRVENLESSFRSAEVNNVTRDSQALSQIRRLDAAVTDAQTAIDAVISLGSSGSTYDINADNITGGTINGVNFNTTGGTESLTLSAGKINFFEGGVGIGSMTADTDGSNDYIQISSSSTIGQLTVGSDYAVLAGDSAAVQVGTFGTAGRIDLTGTNTYCSGNLSVSGTLSATTFNPSSITTGAITGTSLDVGSGNVQGGTILGNSCSITSMAGGSLNVTGSITPQDRILGSIGTYNATAAFAANMFIASNGNIARATGTSSREAKQDITPLEFDKEAFLSVSPVKFKYKDGIITEGENPQTVGFIAEDFVDAGLSEFLVTPKNEYDQYIGLRYEKMYMFLHKVVQDQAATIKALEARIETLESGV